jgi:hypothetical protein
MSDTDKPAESLAASPNGPQAAGSPPSQSELENTAGRKRSSGLKRFVFTLFYVCFLAALGIGLVAGLEYYAYVRVKNSPIGEPYKGRDLDVARCSSQKVAPQFGYEPTPGFAAVRNLRLGNSYEFINEQSFKDFDDLPMDKANDEFRVFVTGGSVVYGRGPVPPSDAVTEFYEVTFRWTIPHIIEQLLNADPRVREKIGGKKVRVVNAGVAGHVIQNNLMRYLAKLRMYKPDMVISLDGANEVHTVARPLKDWNYFAEGPYYEVVIETMDMSRKGFMNYLALWLKRNSYFFTWLALGKGEGPGILMENRGFASHPQDPTPEMIAYREANIGQVADVLAIYHTTLETDRVPHVFAVQPMFRNCKKKRTPMEQKIEQITGMDKIGFYDAAETYDLLVDRIKKRVKEAGLEVVDLTGVYDNVTEWVFTDWCHLTNGANYLIAKDLVNQIKTRIFGLPLGPDDEIKQPADSYFVDYAKTAKVLVSGNPTDKGVHILKGYPGADLLELNPDPKIDGVTLDLGQVLPISRLRVVWGDAASVPKSWKIDVSEDGKTWLNWLSANDVAADAFDQWPGFEYYSAKETPARFVRYSPVGDSRKGPIKLRQLSLFR